MSLRVVLGVVGIASGAALAQDVRPNPSLDLRAISLGGLWSADGPGIYSTGFETVEGYTVNPIEPQLGWTASGTSNPFASVSTANPFAGSQHLRVGFDTLAAPGSQHVVLSPSFGVQPVGPSTSSLMVNIGDDGGANYDVVGQAPSQGLLSWRVLFNFDGGTGGGPGEIFVLDNPGAGIVFVDTNIPWTAGSYNELRVEMDPIADTIEYYYANALIYTGQVFAGTTVEQMVFVSDNFQAQESGDFDNINVIPAPGSLALLGMGLAAAVRRRRR